MMVAAKMTPKNSARTSRGAPLLLKNAMMIGGAIQMIAFQGPAGQKRLSHATIVAITTMAATCFECAACALKGAGEEAVRSTGLPAGVSGTRSSFTAKGSNTAPRWQT